MESNGLSRRTVLLTAFASLMSLRSSRAALTGKWIDSHEQGRFHVASEVPLNSIQAAIDSLGLLEQQIAAYLELTIPNSPIELFLYSNSGNFQRAVQTVSPQMRGRRALYVQSGDRRQILAYVNNALMTDLRHETTHALMHTAVPYFPLWLDEGLAELFEVVLKPGQIHPHLASLKWSCRWRWKPNLSELEQLNDESKMTAAHYRDSCAVAHFLVHGDLRSHQILLDYLSTAQKGEWEGSLTDQLLTVPGIENLILQHVQKNS